MELVRPDLQCSLHGADTGGAFFILSDESVGLAERLVGLPAEFGIGVNPVGEPFANLRRHRAGVLSFPAFTDAIAQAVAQGLPAQSVWNAGDSSAGYAAKNFGTFSMTCEVPLWHDEREGCADPSGRTLGEVIDERVDLIGTDLETLTDYLPSLRSGRDSFDALALTASLEDAREMAAGAVAELRQFRPAAAQDHPLSKADLVLTESGPPGLRTLAMLVRLARVVGERSVTTALVNLLQERIRMVTRAAPLSPVPLRRATDLQIAAIIETARFLS